ncbi:MAG: glycoside hydrolase family 2 TIM barrel-domain containing protein [Bacteroidota bacterium]
MKLSAYLFFIYLLLISSCASNSTDHSATGRTTDFNFDWKFSLDQSDDASQTDFDDSAWRTLNLPHDWVIENSMDSTFEFWEATGRIPGKGIGWYRKSFPTMITEDEVCYLHFDGVYNNATVWINGKELGFHPYGYSPFYFDLTPHLFSDGKKNVVTVRVDHTRYADSRWYTGAGIYRNVELITTNKLHIPVWGVYATTPEVTSELAKIMLAISLKNNFGEKKDAVLNTVILDPAGKTVAEKQTDFSIDKENQQVQTFNITTPQLWNTDNPNLYRAITTIILNGKTVDTYEQTFGIRSIRFNADKGFFLNDQHTLIKGVCLHHDGGLVGAAVPKEVWRRRLQTLKDAGCNAIRSAHNPASSEFLDLCDEMGFLVQDEFFDEWDNPKDKQFNMNQKSEHYETQGYGEHFQKWAEEDIKTTMLSHRNHPSIIQWSIGNEIEWTYPRNQNATGFFNNMDWSGNYFWSEPPFSPKKIKTMLETLPKGKYDIGKTAQRLASAAKQYDVTRPITANCILPSVSHLNGYVDAMDMVGYSYRRVLYDYGHQNYPDVPIMGMENVPQYHEWKAILENPHIAGTYLWTGVDYMGEIRSGYPAKTNASGMLDLAGFEKPSYHMYKTLWQEDPHIFMTTNIYDQIKYGGRRLYKVNKNLEVEEFKKDAWQKIVWGWQTVNEHWNYNPNDTVIVEIFTNCETVELFLNEKSLGKNDRKDFPDNIVKWAIPYQQGELRAVGIQGDNEVATSYNSSGSASSIKANLDKQQLDADFYDVAHIVVQLLDEKGNPSQDDQLVKFEVDKKLKVLGVDNGSMHNEQDFQADQLVTHRGKALLIVQSKDMTGTAKITIQSEGMEEVALELDIK